MAEAHAFPSIEWFQALADELNSSDEYKKAASKYEGALCLEVLKEPGMLEEDIYGYVDPYHGEIREFCIMESPDEKETEFQVSGPYSTWKEIVKGNLDPMQAIMKGKLKVRGSMAKLLKEVKASQAMLKSLKNIPTRYLDEA
ncbi:MAG: SCP2 sterol-binding domain-containing protein [Deltaproteobacteria bacterium]|nr:SCP2 sterol-binding domain-containing protein [Deltaproteobacteria bacterium]